MRQVVIFKAKHRPVWHWDYELQPETIERDGPPDTYRSGCGFETSARFSDYDIVAWDALPSTMCRNCFTALTGEVAPHHMTPANMKPVKLELKAIKGATEGWRPDFMKKVN